MGLSKKEIKKLKEWKKQDQNIDRDLDLIEIELGEV